jgi:DNA-binding transcriptional regulator YhcF (GntR family)
MLRIDLDDPRPIEEQITAGIRQALAQGAVGPDQELPPVRQLAGDLGVHWNTVARAYRRLADEGLVTVRQGRGAITSPRARARVRASRTAIRARFADIIATGLLGGLSRQDLTDTFRDVLASFPTGDRS